MKSIKLELNLIVGLDGTIASLHSSANGSLKPSSFVGTFQGVDIMKVRDQSVINIEPVNDTIKFNKVSASVNNALYVSISARFDVDDIKEDIPSTYLISRIQFGLGDDMPMKILDISGIWKRDDSDLGTPILILGNYSKVVDSDVW